VPSFLARRVTGAADTDNAVNTIAKTDIARTTLNIFLIFILISPSNAILEQKTKEIRYAKSLMLPPLPYFVTRVTLKYNLTLF
jgi:hypothetical protein